MQSKMYLEIALQALHHQLTHATVAQQILVGHRVIIVVLRVHSLELLRQG